MNHSGDAVEFGNDATGVGRLLLKQQCYKFVPPLLIKDVLGGKLGSLLSEQ